MQCDYAYLKNTALYTSNYWIEFSEDNTAAEIALTKTDTLLSTNSIKNFSYAMNKFKNTQDSFYERGEEDFENVVKNWQFSFVDRVPRRFDFALLTWQSSVTSYIPILHFYP